MPRSSDGGPAACRRPGGAVSARTVAFAAGAPAANALPAMSDARDAPAMTVRYPVRACSASAAAFWSAVIARRMDVPSAPVSVRAPASVSADPPAMIDRADAFADEARTNSSNVMRTVPVPRSTTGSPAIRGGVPSAVTVVGPAARPANLLYHWSSTADGETSKVAAGGSVDRYDATTDAFWAGERRTVTVVPWPPPASGSCRCDTDAASARCVVPVVPSAPCMYMPDASAPCSAGMRLSNRSVSVASGRLRSRAGSSTSVGAAESFVVDTVRFDAPPRAFPARSLNAGPAASMSILAGPSALAFAARAADLWAGVSRTTMRSESEMSASDAPSSTVRLPSAESSIAMADTLADDASMYSSKPSASVPRSRFRTAALRPGPPPARDGADSSARICAGTEPRAAPLPDRSDAAPGSATIAAATAPMPPPADSEAALTAACTAAFWPAVSRIDASAVYRDDRITSAPARLVTEGADPLGAARNTDSAMRDGSTVVELTCSSNTACSTPSPMSRYDPDSDADGAVSSGMTASRAPVVPLKALPAKS